MAPTLLKAENPVFANAEGTAILIDTVFSELGDDVQKFLAKPDDREPHGVNLFCRAATGEFGPVAPYEAPAPDALSPLDFKAALRDELEKELFKRMPLFATYRRGIDAINAAETEEQARAALANVQWPNGVASNGVTRKHHNKK